MNRETVLVRGPHGEAHVLLLVAQSGRICQVTDSEGFSMLLGGDYGRVAAVHLEDVYAPTHDVKTGDRPDWSQLDHI